MEQIGAQRCLKKQNPGFFESLGRTRGAGAGDGGLSPAAPPVQMCCGSGNGEEQLWFDHVELVELVVAITGGSLLLQRAHPIAVMGASLTNILLLTWIDVRLPRFSVSLKTTFNVMLSTYLNYIPFGLLRWMILVLVCLQLVDYVAVVRGVWASIDRLRENALGLTRLVSARSHGSGGSVELSLRSEEVCETMPSAGQGITEDQPEDGRPGMSLEVMVLPEAIAELREDSRNSRAAGEESPSSLAEDVFHPALAVLRHSHRADTAFDSEWHETDDKMQFPADCPITVEGIREAQGTAEILAESDFGIIICSPYLRCVQTAVILADRLDLFVLLDYEIGEVFGRLVFSEELCRKFQQQGSVPWRSRRELYQALKSWSTEVSELFEDAPATSSRRPLYHRIGWRRILGQPPKCGETLAGARQRYAKRFLTYLARSRKAKRNMILVSHGHFVETALKLLPSTSARDVTAVRYCGGLMARLCRASPKLVVRTASTDFAWDDAGTQSYEIAESPDWEPSTVARKSEDEEERELVDASLPWWDVNVFGIEFGAKSKRNRTERQVQYEAFLKQLHTQKLTWQRLEELLGELPQGMRPATEGRLSCTSATESINDNDTCSSARMFQRNSWETVRTADFTEGDVAAAPVVAPEQAPAAFNLNELAAKPAAKEHGLEAPELVPGEEAKVRMTCTVLPRKRDWLVRLLEKCPGPKAMVRTIPEAARQEGRAVEFPAGAWRVSTPSAKIDCPRAKVMVEAAAERSLEGAARTTVWLKKQLEMNGDTLHCKSQLAEILRLGPGATLDHAARSMGLGVALRNEAFLQKQVILVDDASHPDDLRFYRKHCLDRLKAMVSFQGYFLLGLSLLWRGLAASWYLVDVPLAVCEEPFSANTLIPLNIDLPGRRDQPHIFTIYRTGNRQLDFSLSVLDSKNKKVTDVEVKLEGQLSPAAEPTATATTTTFTTSTATMSTTSTSTGIITATSTTLTMTEDEDENETRMEKDDAKEFVRLLGRRPGRALSGKGGRSYGGTTGGRRGYTSYTGRRGYTPARYTPDSRRRSPLPVVDSRRRGFDSRRRAPSAPISQGWSNPSHPQAGYYSYKPTYRRHHRTQYGYSGYHVYPSGSSMGIGLAGLGGLGVGYALGSHFGHYRASRWNTMNGGRGFEQCYHQSWQGSCTDCVKGYSMDKCQTSYQLPKAANRDDLMTTAFIPKDYEGPLRLVFSKMVGAEIAKEHICPPEGWHWNASVNTFNGTWTAPDTQDVFISLTPVVAEVPMQPTAPPDHRGHSQSKEKFPIVAAVVVVVFAVLCCICAFFFCCDSDDDDRGRRRSTYGRRRSSYDEFEMQGFRTTATPYVPPAPMITPGVVPAMATPVAVPAMAAVAAGPAVAMAAAVPAVGTAVAAPIPPVLAAPAAKTCHQMHPMHPAVAQSGMECDECERELRHGEQVLRCDACDYDLCMAACARQTTFLEGVSSTGQTWKMQLACAAPALDTSGLLCGPWGEALRAADTSHSWPLLSTWRIA
ncbi:unnamed protein product [Symbiodinium pilosum]|uniref:Uncharacterized protein n=1 Tax=Symbiodinium pilosum TaxID=2952 RepID=A0A812WGJ1_SYMPI|nr:unnamed protein product [Symbiodinium pilosum]